MPRRSNIEIILKQMASNPLSNEEKITSAFERFLLSLASHPQAVHSLECSQNIHPMGTLILSLKLVIPDSYRDNNTPSSKEKLRTKLNTFK